MTQPLKTTQVKICGIRDEMTLQQMAGLPVDYIGFVFAPSKRQVTAEQADALWTASQAIICDNDRPPRAVGVFVNPTMEQLAEVLAEVPLHVIQLHGQETPDFCRAVGERFGIEVWRAFSAEEPEYDGLGPVAERLAAFAGVVSTVLIDTAGGGTGRMFPWQLIPVYQEQARLLDLRLFVAGGLTPDNISELLTVYSPDGVDTSSGVETEGTKDIKKIAAFAERVSRS